MPWKLLDYSERDLKQKLSVELGVQGIPTLVLFNESGELITTEGTGIILTLPLDKIRTYKEDSERELVQLNQWMASLPDSLVHECHEHPLSKVYDIYGEGGFGCDICAGGGEMWAYHCAECGFDVHPECVVPR